MAQLTKREIQHLLSTIESDEDLKNQLREIVEQFVFDRQNDNSKLPRDKGRIRR